MAAAVSLFSNKLIVRLILLFIKIFFDNFFFRGANKYEDKLPIFDYTCRLIVCGAWA